MKLSRPPNAAFYMKFWLTVDFNEGSYANIPAFGSLYYCNNYFWYYNSYNYFIYKSCCALSCFSFLFKNHFESPSDCPIGISWETQLFPASSFLFSNYFLFFSLFILCNFLIFSISYKSTTKHFSSVWSSLIHSLQKTV